MLYQQWRNGELYIRDPEDEFQEIDKNNGGTISFEEFCNYAIQQSLDLEDDDDEELKI